MFHLRMAPPKVVLAGPDEQATPLCAVLQSRGWLCEVVPDMTQTLSRVRRTPDLDLVVACVTSELTPAIEVCRSIKFDHRRNSISVVFLVSPEAADDRVFDAISAAGADDCLVSGGHEQELKLRLERAVHFRRATESLEDSTVVIKALAAAIEGKDSYTCGHVDRVATYSVSIGRRLGLSADELTTLQTGGIVHDIGKIGIPDAVLNKPGRLTDEEFEIIKRHPLIGHGILKPLRSFENVLPIVRWHHERPNGRGYPDGLSDAELPLLPRIVAVADCFDALSTDRPYRAALSLEQCREILEGAIEKGELDPEVTRIQLDIMASVSQMTGVPCNALVRSLVG